MTSSVGTVSVLLVPASSTEAVTVVQVDPEDLDWETALVGDYNTDAVFGQLYPVMMFVSASGKHTAAARNPRAAQLMELALPGYAKTDWVAGPAVFVGLTDSMDYTDLPGDFAAVVRNLFLRESRAALTSA